MAFFKGYLTGLALIILIGPVLFVLLNATLQKGKVAGISVAMGIFISDILAVTLTLLGFSKLFQNHSFQKWVALLGGMVLGIMGFFYLLRSGIPPSSNRKNSGKTIISDFIQGFLVNFINPFVFIVWIGIITAASLSYGRSPSLYLYLSGTLLGILTLDISKVFLATRLQPILQPKKLKILFQISGLILIAFGIRMIYFWFQIQ